jgi:hypothetical protein
MFVKLVPKITALFLSFALLAAQPASVFAFETDQYNLSDAPLADIGDEVSAYVEENVRAAVAKINAKIAASRACLENAPEKKRCASPVKEKAKLAHWRSEDALVTEIFRPLGGGIPPFTNSGTWLEKHEFKSFPARYKTSFDDSIFKVFPSNYLSISETVNLYGVEFGTDKIAHIFQQGYTYYKIHKRAEAKGLSPEKAARKANNWGRMTERTFYGTLISGVYSNADLAANYAGLKFYQNLTKQTKIGEKTYPAILVLKSGFWEFGEPERLRENLLKPFISDHLNEALNPSIFIKLFWLDSYVRETVRKQSCAAWRKEFPGRTQSDFAEITERLRLWHGEEYGFKSSSHFITIANTCFAQEKPENAAL